MNNERTPNTYRKELKDLIIYAADGLFKKNGVKSVRMDDIAQQLSISKRTLYEIYENKEQVIFEVVRRHHQQIRENLAREAAFCHNVIEILTKFYYLHLEELCTINPQFFIDLNNYPPIMEFLSQQTAEREANSKKFFKRGIREGYFLSEANYDIIFSISKACLDHVMSSRMYRRYPLQELYRNTMLLIMRGICTTKGVKLLEKALNDQPSL